MFNLIVATSKILKTKRNHNNTNTTINIQQSKDKETNYILEDWNKLNKFDSK